MSRRLWRDKWRRQRTQRLMNQRQTSVHWGPRVHSIPMKGMAAAWVPLILLSLFIQSPEWRRILLAVLTCSLAIAVALSWRGWPRWLVWVVRAAFAAFVGWWLILSSFFSIGVAVVSVGLVVAFLVGSRNLQEQHSRDSWKNVR